MKLISFILLIVCISVQPLQALDDSASTLGFPDLASLTGLPPEINKIITDNLDDLGNLIKYQIIKSEPEWQVKSLSSSAQGDYLAISLQHKFENLRKVLLFKVNAKTAKWELYKTYEGCDYAALSPNGKHIALVYHYGHIAFYQPTVKAVAAIENIDGTPLMEFRIDNQNIVRGLNHIFSWSANSEQLIGNFNCYRILWGGPQAWHRKVERVVDALEPIFLGNKLFFIDYKKSQDERSRENLTISLVTADDQDNPEFKNSVVIWKYPSAHYPLLIKNSRTIGVFSKKEDVENTPTLSLYNELNERLEFSFDRGSPRMLGPAPFKTKINELHILSPNGNFLASHLYPNINIYRRNAAKKHLEFISSIKLEYGVKHFDWLADGKGLVVINHDNEIEIFVTQGKTLQLKNDRLAFFDRHRSFFKNAAMVIGGLIACGVIYYLWSKFSWDAVVGYDLNDYPPGYPLFTSAFNKLFLTSTPP